MPKQVLHTAVVRSQPVAVGLSRSEGGFKENKVSSASVLDVQAANDKKGKPYYKYEILTRTGRQLLLSTKTSTAGQSSMYGASRLQSTLQGYIHNTLCHPMGLD